MTISRREMIQATATATAAALALPLAGCQSQVPSPKSPVQGMKVYCACPVIEPSSHGHGNQVFRGRALARTRT